MRRLTHLSSVIPCLAGACLVGLLAGPPVAFAQPRPVSFSSERDGDNEIYILPAGGGDLVQITDNDWDDYGHGWSHDGSQIAFSSDRDGNYEIYIMNADGSNAQRLTNRPHWDFQPRWSPDGTRIVFTSELSGSSDIYVMNSDGTDLTRLTTHPAYDSGGDWSPDGEQIVFDSQRSGNPDIYIMNANGTDVHNLTSSPEMDISPMWSPLGDRISFQKYVDGNWEIFTMDTTGGELRRLTYTADDNQQATWSSDAALIVYMTRQDPGPYHDIWFMNADGTDQQQLTDNPAQDWYCAWVPPHPAAAPERTWAPDNLIMPRCHPNPCRFHALITYELAATAQVELLVLDAAGRLVKVLQRGRQTAGHHGATWAGWSAQGRVMPAGTYYCRLTVGEQTAVRPLTWIR